MQRALTTSAVGVTPSALFHSRRTYFAFQFANFHGWTLPYGGKQTKVTKEDLQNMRYFNTRSREKWDYNRIDETINASSEFRDRTNRPDFDGTRVDKEGVEGHTHTPGHYRLHHHFEEYSKPGIDPKFGAAMAVKEQWDADEFYYPGDAWKKNRPGFRSVPKEILNKQTWYHWTDTIFKMDEVQTTYRCRSWTPNWPPPGYKVPKLQCQKKFEFGVEDPSVVAEVERYYWYRSWIDNNLRSGPKESILILVGAFLFWAVSRDANDQWVQLSMFSNMYYPGRTLIRSFGTPKDWETDCFWWQRPLEEFPNQGEVWHMSETRYGYMRYIEKRDERERLEAQL